MPRKIQRIKGQAKIEERYQFNKKLNKSYKHYILITIKILVVDYSLK